MAKKREFASDSDVSRFISRKQNPDGKQNLDERERVQVTIYPDKGELEEVKILAKVKDKNLNAMILDLMREAMEKEEYQKIVMAYEKMKEML